MKYKFILSLTLFSLLLNSFGQNSFPYSNPLRSANGMTLLSGGTANLPSFSTAGMMLTNSTSQFSGAYITGLNFSTQKGFIVEFEYTMDNSTTSSAADGFSVILFDSSVSDKHLGVRGGGLGYSPNRLSITDPNQRGFSGAYLGIGFDQWGNFRRQISYSPDTWVQGLNVAQSASTLSQITVRGPSNGNEYDGYPMIRSVVTAAADQTSNGYQLLSDGTYGAIGVGTFAPFQLRSSEQANLDPVVDATSPRYRKVRIGMYPFGEDLFYLNVSVYIGGATGVTIAEVLKDISISTSGTINYNDITPYNASYGNNLSLYPNNGLIARTLSMSPPPTLNLAFAGSTGGGYQRQIIRNMSVALPFAAAATNDNITGICSKTGSVSQFSVLDNDLGYNNLYYTPGMDLLVVGNKDNLDKASFRFKVFNTATGVYDPTPNSYVYTSSSGTYTYDPTTGLITFAPNAGLGDNVTDELYYDIKNKSTAGTINLGSEEYRSNTAIVTVNISSTVCDKVITKFFKING